MSEIASLFRTLTLGVYVVGVSHGKRRNALTVAWITQTSFRPPMLALSINPNHASYELLHAGGGFTVNVLCQDQMELARHFGTRSAREVDKLVGVEWHPGRSGAPILDEAIAHFDCVLTGSVASGDHEIVLGRVVDGHLLAPSRTPLTYAETGDLDGSSALQATNL